MNKVFEKGLLSQSSLFWRLQPHFNKSTFRSVFSAADASIANAQALSSRATTQRTGAFTAVRTFAAKAGVEEGGEEWSKRVAKFREMKAPIAEAMKVGDQSVLYKDKGGIRVVTLNRPRALNALNQDMIFSLYKNFKLWDDARLVSGIFVKGEGKAFCAGGDVKAVTTKYKQGLKDEVMAFFATEYQLNHLIATMKTPYVAFLDGVTMGGGAGISVHGHFRIATENTLFAMPECGLGLFTDVGATHFLTHEVEYELGVYMALTGARIKAGTLVEVGLATHFIPSHQLEQLESRLSDVSWGARDPDMVDALIGDIADPNEYLVSADPIVTHAEEIKDVFKRNTIEDICDRLRHYAEGEAAAASPWAAKALDAIMKGSPTSLKVTFEALKRSRVMTLEEALKMEYRMLHRFMEGHDFYEGVRAILVDKDNKPTWQPASLAEVTDQMVAEYFDPVPTELQFTHVNEYSKKAMQGSNPEYDGKGLHSKL